MKEVTLGRVLDYLEEKEGYYLSFYDFIEAGVIKDRAALLELAKKGYEIQIAEINYNRCDCACDYIEYGEDGGYPYSKCMMLGGRRCYSPTCLCGKKCASKYVEKNKQLLNKIIDSYNNNKSDFFKTINFLSCVKNEVKNLVIDDMEALKKCIHKYLVSNYEKDVQEKIENAKERYERVVKEGEKKIKKRKEREEKFWREI